jgi:hypothetical protein
MNGVGFRALLMGCSSISLLVFGLPGCLTGTTLAGDHELSQKTHDIVREKGSRSEEEKKISSDLLDAMWTLEETKTERHPSGRSEIDLDQNGVLVDIQAEVSEVVLEKIERSGGQVISAFPQYRAIRARVPLQGLRSLAALPQVTFIRSASKALTR